MAKKEEVIEDVLAKALADIDKLFGKGSTIVGDAIVDVERLSTGSLGLDIATGGGWGKGRIIELYGPESSGKAQPLTSKVLTPKGFVTMGSLEVGSIVCTPDGQNSTVVGIFEQGVQDVYEVIFDDKSSTRCTLDHLWYVEGRSAKFGDVLSLKEIMDIGIKEANVTRNRFRIPIIEKVTFDNDVKLPMNPYLLGLILGDGGLSAGGVRYSTSDPEIIDNISEILRNEMPNTIIKKVSNTKYDHSFIKSESGKGRCDVYNVLESLGLLGTKSHTKFIPDMYLYTSFENRLALLQGLMDSDGSVDSGTLSFTTTSKRLSDSFVELVRSLGLRCTTSSRITKYKNSSGAEVDGKPSYRSSLLMTSDSFKIFRLKRQIDKKNWIASTFSRRFIEDVKLVGREECRCIAIGHPDKLYITDDYIVTHNTSISLHTIAEAQRQGGRVAFIDAEHAFDRTYAEALGVDCNKLIVSQPDNGEMALEIADRLIHTGLISVIVVDSVAALVPKSELEGDMGDFKMGGNSRLMNQAMRKLVGAASKTNTVVIFINQLREKLGVMFGSPETTVGGNALKFAASIRVDVRRKAGSANKEGEILYNTITCKTIKNKLAAPFKKAVFDIKYGKGISRESEILELGQSLGLIVANGSWYSYMDSKLGQGADKVVTMLEDNPELAQEIEQKIRNHYGI
jgi:recombination protein RecA